jgi:prepilin-type N-terminal cleavage/methylation domain-containing protein
MMYQQKWHQVRVSTQSGFTLVEMLVAIAILAILMTVAVLAIPNHDDRYWRDNLDQLVGSLNMAQEESALSGTTMLVQIDAQGWRFVPVTWTPVSAPNPMISMGGLSSNQPTAQESIIGTSGLMPDVYRSQAWYKPIVIEPVQLTLGGETIMQGLQIPLVQEKRRALLMRATNGRFSWVNGVTQ